MFILGLGHRARHGKDTVARAIVSYCAQRGVYAKQYGFADALKAHCRVAFGMREKDAPLLQMVGTDLYRRTDPNIWVRVLLDTIAEQEPDVAIITDVRFPNEAEAIRAKGGAVVKVERRNEDGSLWVAGDRNPNHPSEIALANYPFDEHLWVYNGEVDTLKQIGTDVFEQLWQRQAA